VVGKAHCVRSGTAPASASVTEAAPQPIPARTPSHRWPATCATLDETPHCRRPHCHCYWLLCSPCPSHDHVCVVAVCGGTCAVYGEAAVHEHAQRCRPVVMKVLRQTLQPRAGVVLRAFPT